MNATISPTKPRLGAGRVAFLARKDAIAAKIEAGYPLLMIYREYQKLLPIGYAQFANYVRKYLKSESVPETGPEEETVHFTLQVQGLVKISQNPGLTFGKDMKVDINLTLDERTGSPEYGDISKFRIFQIKQEIYEQLSSRFKEMGHD